MLDARQHTEADTTFSHRMVAAPVELRPMRRRLAAWLGGLHLPGETVMDIVTATDEACANAIEHGADCDPSEQVAVEAHVALDRVVVLVSGPGAWRHVPSGPHRGRGLLIMRGLMDEVLIRRDPDRSTVRLVKVLDD